MQIALVVFSQILRYWSLPPPQYNRGEWGLICDSHCLKKLHKKSSAAMHFFRLVLPLYRIIHRPIFIPFSLLIVPLKSVLGYCSFSKSHFTML